MSRTASSCKLMSVEETVEEFRNGRMVILADDEERENEGDLVIPAQMATPEAINFMARYGRGLICLALGADRVRDLGLELMPKRNESRHDTAFTVSIEAREGVTTGISASDRARTIAVAIDPRCGPDDLTSPGPCLPARRPRRRRAGAHRAYRGERGPGTPRRPQPVCGDLRDHERRRDHGADARSRGLLPAPQRQDGDHRGSDRLSPPPRQNHRTRAGDHAHLPSRRYLPHVRLHRHRAEGAAHRAGEGRCLGQRAGARAGPCLQHPR